MNFAAGPKLLSEDAHARVNMVKNTVEQIVAQNVQNFAANLVPSSKTMIVNADGSSRSQPAEFVANLADVGMVAACGERHKPRPNMVSMGAGVDKLEKSVQTDKSYLLYSHWRTRAPANPPAQTSHALNQPPLPATTQAPPALQTT